jgi:phage tail-like protein
MQATRIKQLLPAIFQDACEARRPLQTFLEIMEKMHVPVEQKLDDLDCYLDPRRAPEEFLPMLAAWVGIDFPVTTKRLRELIATYVQIQTLRGTRSGLIALLETATGETGFTVKEDPTDDPGPFHIVVTAPFSATAHERLLHLLIRREKPAYVTYSLRWED